MIIRVFNTGRSNGEAPVNYLLGEYDHTGKPRSVLPEILEGSAATTIAVINSIPRKFKYVSGVIAFHADEKPSRQDLQNIINTFKKSVLPGLNADHFNSLFVLHQEKLNTEVHFVVPSIEFASGRNSQLNIHFPGPRNLALYNTLTKVLNHEMGYNQVIENPIRSALSGADRKSPRSQEKRRTTKILTAEITTGLRNRKFANRRELCSWLEESLDVKVTRQGEDYISVRLPGSNKATRLKGPLFKRDADYRSLQAKSEDPVPVRVLTGTEFEASKDTLAMLVQERASFNKKAYFSPRTLPKSARDNTATVHPPGANKTSITQEKSMPIKEMRKIIREALTIANEVKGQKPVAFEIKSKTEAVSGMLAVRSKALKPEGISQTSTLDAIQEVQNAIGLLQTAIDGAVADLAAARTPKDKQQAEARLASLLMQMSRLNQQLKAAKVRQINQPSGSKLKI